MDVRRIRIFLGTVSDSEKIGYCYVCLVFLFGFLSFHYGSGYSRWHYRCLCGFLPVQYAAGNESGKPMTACGLQKSFFLWKIKKRNCHFIPIRNGAFGAF